MTGPIRRLDHVAVLVRDTDRALEYFTGVLGLPVVHSEKVAIPPVRLTYLDAGNAAIQLVEPLDPDSALAADLERDGEGLHHVCFGTEDPIAAAAALSTAPRPVVAGSGRGRISAFVPATAHGVRVECTELPLGAPAELPLGAPAELPLGAPAELPLGAPAELPLGAPAEPPLDAPSLKPES